MSEHATQTHRSRPELNHSSSAAKTEDVTSCSDCGSTAVATDREGAKFCQDCGMVLSEAPIERSEPSWKPRDERRTGPSGRHLWLQKGTKIGYSQRVSSFETKKLTRFNNRLTYSEKSLTRGLREVRSLAAALNLPRSTAERAAYMYRKADRENLLQGRSMDAIAAACVYIAARRNGPPLTFSWVADASPVTESDISTAYRTVLSKLNLTMCPPDPQEFLPRVASAVGVSYRVQRKAHLLLEEVISAGIHVGQSPPGVAGAVLYGAAKTMGEEVTQESVATKAGVSAVTLSRQWQNIKEIDDSVE